MKSDAAGARLPSVPTSWFGRLRAAIDHLARSSPSRFAILIFTTLIMVFTLLFTLPITSATGTMTPLHDALFTAV